jgi:hypothetical protein
VRRRCAFQEMTGVSHSSCLKRINLLVWESHPRRNLLSPLHPLFVWGGESRHSDRSSEGRKGVWTRVSVWESADHLRSLIRFFFFLLGYGWYYSMI